MASITITICALTSPTIADGRAAASAAASHCVSPRVLPARRSVASLVYRHRSARNVVAMATGDAPVEVELPEVVKSIQDAWDKVEDKYAVASIGFAGFIALWVSTGMISAIDRLPFVPGILELVGIGYTGWFAYRNLIYKPDREALISKIKSTYSDITGSD